MNPTERLVRRRLVDAFISADQIMVSFVREVKVGTPARGYKVEKLPPLPPQRARLVTAKRRYNDDSVNTEAGNISKWPYLLIGLHDMDVRENDSFVIDSGKYVVRSLMPNHEERTVAALEYFGG